MANYDIGDALSRIENLLLQSMSRNLHRHLGEEQDEGFRWSMWQAEQMTALRNWSAQNLKQHGPEFTRINDAAMELLRQSGAAAELAEERRLLESGMQQAAAFFSVSEDKMGSLLHAVRSDLSRAEHSILRQADDLYRKAVFDAHLYLQTGSGTLNNAIDMAVQDLMTQGVRAVTYRNGHRVEASVYARMALRTANVRAKLTGEGRARDQFGVHTVLVSPSGIACEKCAKWMGKVLIDDVYCSGTAEEADAMRLPLLSEAIAQGLLHPQCNCAVHTYHPGISKRPDVTEQDREDAVRRYKLTQQQRYNERQIRKWKYAGDAAPDEAARKAAHAKVRSWQKANKVLCDSHPDILRRDYEREKIWDALQNPVLPDVIEKLPPMKNKLEVLAKPTPVSDSLDSKILEHIFDAISGKSYEGAVREFEKHLPEMKNKTVSKILQRTYDRTTFLKSDKKNSYFEVKDKVTDKIVMRVRLAKSSTPSTIAHELFHKIDYENKITSSGMLDACLASDYKNLKKLAEMSGQTLEDMLYLKYPEAFVRRGKMKDAFRGISDVIHGMTDGKIFLGYGHNEKDYWKKPKKLQKETFAQYGRFYFEENQEVSHMVSELFPETTKQMQAIINAISQLGR